MNISSYIAVAAGKCAVNVNEASVLQRGVLADMTRAGVTVTADLTDSYRSEIDRLVKKMHAKRTPLEERVPVPYTAKVGEHKRALAALKDPLNGEPLSVVVLTKNRRVLYNAGSGVVYPIPKDVKV